MNDRLPKEVHQLIFGLLRPFDLKIALSICKYFIVIINMYCNHKYNHKLVTYINPDHLHCLCETHKHN